LIGLFGLAEDLRGAEEQFPRLQDHFGTTKAFAATIQAPS